MTVEKNHSVGPDIYHMELQAPEIAGRTEPGQFVHLKVRGDGCLDPLLRRPFSIHDIDNKKGTVSLVYRVVGRGTEILSSYRKRDRIDILGPLGNGFNTGIRSKRVVIIGGGMGLAPLYLLSRRLSQFNQVEVFAGGEGRDDLEYFLDNFNLLDIELKTATIDGSIGFKGKVTELWDRLEYCPDYIFACGPRPMLQEVQKIAGLEEIPGQLSLEERMACGTGVCLSCSCKTKKGNKRVCKDGPVFALDEVIFNGKN